MNASTRRDEFVDPRIERSRRVIQEATLMELADVGYGGFTIESVADRAGVGKSTVYRHFGGKLALIAHTLETLNEQPSPDAGEGTPREQVERLLVHLAEVMADSTLSAAVPALIEAAERHKTVRDFYHRYSARRRQTLVGVIAVGIASGDFPAELDPDLASLALIGPIFYRRLLSDTPFESSRIPGLVKVVLGPDSTD